MVSLTRAPNGDWFCRKAISADVRDAGRTAHGVSHEEGFRRPASVTTDRAKQELRDWDALISGPIAAIRAAANGEGRLLTQREAHALAGEWYVWFVGQNEDEPGTPEGWDLEREQLEDAYSRFAPINADHHNVDDS